MDTLQTSLEAGVAHIRFNRPDKANALNATMWRELRDAMQWLDATPEARVGVLSAAGRVFCTGIDLEMLQSLQADTADTADSCGGRGREKLRRAILDIQDTVTSIERCRKPVLAAVHGACVGGGIDIITACDMRYCSEQAWFTVKEIDVGLVADVGTLQRLPRLVGDGMARELAYTGRRFSAQEAERMRLVNAVHATPEALASAVQQLAQQIASKSPLCIRGAKEMIGYMQNHSVADGLNYVATWNAAMLFSDDLPEALQAARDKRPGRYRD